MCKPTSRSHDLFDSSRFAEAATAPASCSQAATSLQPASPSTDRITSFVVSVGAGTQIFTLDPQTRTYIRSFYSVAIPRTYGPSLRSTARTTAIGKIACAFTSMIFCADRDGRAGRISTCAETATPASDIYRILMRGGIFLYPADLRDGYTSGRLRLVYEANPLASSSSRLAAAPRLAVRAFSTSRPRRFINTRLSWPAPKAEVDYVVRLHHEPHGPGERSPLFGRRGLFRT